MNTLKTIVNDASVVDFIATVADETRRHDSVVLLDIYSNVTGIQPKMWGLSIIGFGRYHYKSQRSRQEGDWPLVGFSPRKQSLTLYMMEGFEAYADQLSKLGKHKTSVSCLYINKLADVDMKVLEELVGLDFEHMKQKYL